MGASDVLIPTKFILIALQLLITISIYFTKHQNVFAGLPLTTIYGSDEYNSANSSVLAAIVLSLLCLILELLLIFTGVTLFFHRLNIWQVIIHALGVILYAWFVLGTWHYNTLWILWAALSLIPIALEISSVCSGTLYYRRLNK